MTALRSWLEDRALHFGHHLVPASQQADWLHAWKAELWYERSRGRHDLAMGLITDALWLRMDCVRQALTGTALLCLLLLCGLAGVAALPTILFALQGAGIVALVTDMLPRFAVASILTLFVSYATSFAGFSSNDAAVDRLWLRASAFHLIKVLLLLSLSALVSTDLCLPLEATRCFAAMPLQLLFFVILALFGLRWNFLDGQARCKHCLRSLAPPQRIGRPSWNFLEYNGTELACREGHGLLSIPELETSWCRTSAWVSQRC